ncbi:ead/Ea22-like family protein [Enterobacter hormaechei]|uniref:ead/Ea22-like family protein n=1 Tax=Enterobacter hormaechei TaxID=158836 RepID=UPI0038AFACC2
MSNIDKRALREAAEKATKGEWWSDVVETDGEYGDGEDRVSGYHSYAVYVGHESLLDMTNSTAACIHTEWDHDYQMAWDETAKRNAEFIAAANPATVLALLDELEAKDKSISFLKDQLAQLANFNPDWDMLEAATYSLREHMAELTAARKRIAELEATQGKPVMFIDGDISSADADKLAAVIREFNEETETPAARMARIIRENPHPTNMCDMPAAAAGKGE